MQQPITIQKSRVQDLEPGDVIEIRVADAYEWVVVKSVHWDHVQLRQIAKMNRAAYAEKKSPTIGAANKIERALDSGSWYVGISAVVQVEATPVETDGVNWIPTRFLSLVSVQVD